MTKNTSGQKIGAQMVSATDGSAFTSAVTVSVTGDAGTQATGSVGSGACTHEGNGFHTYAPAQAETNYDHIAFTFTGTGAVPATVQVYTVAGDAFTRLGAPAGASVRADVAAVKADTAAILIDTGTTLDARIPAALVGGRMDASVGAMASGVLTATAIAADAITDAKVAADVTIASVTGAVGSVTGAVGSVTGAVGSVTGNVGGNVTGSVGSVTGNVGGNVTGSVGSVAAGGITASSIAADAIGASELAADAVAEIADAVWDEVLSGHLTSGTTGAGLNAAGSAGDPWSTAVPGAYGAGTAGKILGDNLNATVSSRASQTSVDTVDDFLDTEIAAIKAKTDNLPAAPAAVSDIPTAAGVADAVWDEARAGHVGAGSFGEGVILTSAYDAAKTAATQASVNTIDDFLDTEVAGILAAVDTEVGAIKTTTDQLTFTTANKVDARAFTVDDKTGYSIASGGIGSGAHAAAELNALADAFLDRNMATGTDSGANNTTTRTVRQALRRLRNKEAIAAGTLSTYKEDDTTVSWTAAVTTTAGDPLSAVDPT